MLYTCGGSPQKIMRNNWTSGLNPVTPMSDQDRISPYNIKQTSDEN